MFKTVVPLFIGVALSVVSPAWAHTKCEPRLSVDHSVHQGILSHGEHWIDLILALGSEPFGEIARGLMDALATGEFETVNEKIDGSPSIVFGWTNDGTPFVAYKNHFSGKKQKLVTDEATALSVFPRSDALKKIFSQLYSTMSPLMAGKSELRNYIFQGDLLFVEGDDRRTIDDEGVRIKPNTVEYLVPPHDDLYAALSTARVGIAMHSVGRRIVGTDGRLEVAPLPGSVLNHRHLIERFVEEMTHQSAFLIHPLRDNQPLASAVAANEIKLASELMKRIEERISQIPAGFSQFYRTHLAAELRVFFNSQVRPPNDGGIYKMVASGEAVSAGEILKSFAHWMERRKDQKPAQALSEISTENRSALTALIEAYVYAIELQYLILPHLSPVMRSKLGGGPVEGLILTTETAIVKFVDRLEFTLQNNQKRSVEKLIAQSPENPFALLPYPLNEWRPGTNFVLMKGQPVHAGHVQMVKLASDQLGPVTVLASQKAPNLEATDIKQLGATATLKNYAARDYTHIFSNDLRGMILKSAFKDTVVTWAHIQTTDLWKYLAVAKELGLSGKVRLIVGQKEVDEGRYDVQAAEFPDHLELTALPLQKDGISATQIRKLVREAALGSKDARQALDDHYGFITSDWKRTQVIRGLLREWKSVDKKAQELLSLKKAKRKAS